MTEFERRTGASPDKKRALEMLAKGFRPSSVAQSLGVSLRLIGRWAKERDALGPSK